MLSKWMLRAAVAVGVSLSAATAFAADLTLRYSSWLPTNSWVNTDIMHPWFKEVERVTQGRVKVEVLPKVVGTAATQFDVVRDGLADMSLIIPGYTPGRFPLTEMGELPFFETNITAIAAPAFSRIYNKYIAPRNEFAGVEMLVMVVTSPGHVFTREKPIKAVTDFAGQKLRSVGSVTSRALELLNAVPILKPSTEGFELMTTGIIDGTLSGPENMVVSKMAEAAKQGTIIPGGFYHAPVAVVANPAAWSKISANDRESIKAISHDVFAEKIGKAYDAADNAAWAAMEKRGTINIITADKAFMTAMKEKLQPVEDAWIEKAKKAGLENPAAVLAEMRADILARTPK